MPSPEAVYTFQRLMFDLDEPHTYTWSQWKEISPYITNLYSRTGAGKRTEEGIVTQTWRCQEGMRTERTPATSMANGVRKRNNKRIPTARRCSVTLSVTLQYANGGEKRASEGVQEPLSVLVKKASGRQSETRHSHNMQMLIDRKPMSDGLRDELVAEIKAGVTLAKAVQNVKTRHDVQNLRKLTSRQARHAIDTLSSEGDPCKSLNCDDLDATEVDDADRSIQHESHSIVGDLAHTPDPSSPAQLTLYGAHVSDCTARIRIALRLKSLSYKEIIRSHSQSLHNVMDSNLNPSQTVPTLTIQHSPGNVEKVVLTQSIAALEYLDEAFPDPCRLLPPIHDPIARAQVRTLVQIISTDIHPLTTCRVSAALPSSKEPSTSWELNWIRKGLQSYEKLVSKTAGTYSVGDQITLADVCLMPQLWTATKFGFDIAELPIIYAIFQRLSSLDAFAQDPHPTAKV